MRVEELLEKGIELEVGRVQMYNRQTATGAQESIVQVNLQRVSNVMVDFNNPSPYFELSFDISRSQLNDYLPGTKFHLTITPAK